MLSKPDDPWLCFPQRGVRFFLKGISRVSGLMGVNPMRAVSHFCNRTVFLIICCILVSCGGTTVTSVNWTGTTYYVDATNGNDNNSGISQAAPWKTIAKVNSSSFQPGDSILFKRGDVWREFLIPPSSGSPGNPITFGAYGTGANPIISGADVWVGFVNGGVNIWDLSGVAIKPHIVTINGVVGTKQASRAACISAGDWFWGSNQLSVYAESDPSGNVEGGQRVYGIGINNKTYITIQGISVKNANRDGIRVNSSTGIIIDNVNSIYNYITGVNFAVGTSCTLKNSTLTYNLGSGVKGSDLSESTIENNTLTYNAQFYDAADDNHHYMAGLRMTGTDSTNNILQNNNASNNVYGRGIWLDFCGTGNIVRYNLTASNWGPGIYNEITSGSKIYSNISHSNAGIPTASGICIEGRDTPDYPANNNEVYNNTLWGNEKYGLLLYNGDSVQGNCRDNIIKNNIIGNTTNGPELGVKGGAQNEVNTITYNTFGAERSNFIQWGNAFGSTYAVWEAVVGNTYSVKSDPQLVNPANADFHLQPTSPAINAGTNVGLTRDYAGTSVPQGSAPDIGAYEYVPP
jgi:hypothetical protein